MSSSLKVIQYFSSRVEYYIFNKCHLLDDKGINLLKVIILYYTLKNTQKLKLKNLTLLNVLCVLMSHTYCFYRIFLEADIIN